MLNQLKSNQFDRLVTTPGFIWHPAKFLLKKKGYTEYLESLEIARYARYLLKHFDAEWEKAVKNRRCMVIEKGPYNYAYCNVAVINNIMSLIIYALYKGCVPVVNFNENEPDFFKWDWYFEQPCDIEKTDITGFQRIPCDIVSNSLKVDMQKIHTPKAWEFRIFKLLYRRFVKFNEKTRLYVEEEIRNIGDPSQMLGVLIRGTDYVKIHPSGHPVQPEPEEIVQKVHELFQSGKYTAAYVATEERKLYNLVGSAIGQENLRQNKRRYYDDIYYQDNVELIGTIHFDRDDDNYWKGIEYLSSLAILSKCRSLVAGNCGGTLYAMMMADYDQPMIFNYGTY